jgi:glycosyltransferase involved in cell wall biosynthesis
MQNVHGLLGTWHRAVDLFVAPSEFTRQKFIQAGLDPARIVVKPNFVAPDPGPNDTAGDHAVYAGRLAPEKGVMTMLRAWQAIDMPLRIIGDGPLHEAVEAYVRDHDLGSRVTLMGHRAPAEVLAQLRDARVVVFPSEWYETFGRVIAEAYACGVPVIASRLGAMAEVVRHGETGLLFTAGSAQELTAAVEQLRRPGVDYESMRREARLEYERTFTAERNRVLLLDIYERARRVRDARGVRSSSPRSV